MGVGPGSRRGGATDLPGLHELEEKRFRDALQAFLAPLRRRHRSLGNPAPI